MMIRHSLRFSAACLALLLAALGTARAQGFAFQNRIGRTDSVRTFHEIQRSARAYFDALGDARDRKGSGHKQYARWEWFWEQRVDRAGRFPAPDRNMREWASYVEKQGASLARGASQAGAWRPLGPFEVPRKGNDGLGRLNCITFHPTDPNTFWVGAPAGGLWRTTDFGGTWTPLTDQLPVLGVSDIAVDPRNPDVIYIATGDGDMGSLSGIQTDMPFVDGDTRSIGVLRTTNGGVTWAPTGLGFQTSELVLIRRLLMDPADPNTLIAASSIGILRTGDAGATWSLVAQGFFMDLEFHPTNPSIVYATTSGVRGDPAAFYRSGDNGRTWVPTGASDGVIRMKIGVTPQRPNRVDILCASLSSSLAGIFTSADAGQTFNQSGYMPDSTMNRPNLLGWYDGFGGDFAKGQGTYDLAYAIAPDNAAEMYVGGVNTWKTTNGGANWDIANFWSVYPSDAAYNTKYDVAHADKHFLRFHPLKPDHLFECNDGGLWFTSDRGATWTNISSGLQIGQAYRIATSQHEEATLLAGHQDNATWMLDQGVWRQAGVGDGMEVAIDPVDRNTMYRVGQYGSIFRSFRRLEELADASKIDEQEMNAMVISANIPGMYEQFQGSWLTPFVIDPLDHRTLYTGMYQVFKSTNQGDSWFPISPINTSIEKVDEQGNPVPLHIRTLTVSPVNPNIIWAGTFEDVSVTMDGGLTWGLIGYRLSQTVAITSLTAHPVNPQYCFATLSGYEPGAKVFVLDLQTGEPTNLSLNLPNVPVNTAHYDRRNGGGLYVGTDIGVFYLSLADPSGGWQMFSDGLPRVVVTDLDIHEGLGVLRAATFGRGVWESPLPGTSSAPAPESAASWSVRALDDAGVYELSATAKEGERAIVYDLLGRPVEELAVRAATTRIDLRSRPAGIYFVALGSDGFKRLERFVKVR